MIALAKLCGEEPRKSCPRLGGELAAGEGYFAVGELAIWQEMEVRTVISDPQAAPRPPCRAKQERQSPPGQARRDLERGFGDVLDHGAGGGQRCGAAKS